MVDADDDEKEQEENYEGWPLGRELDKNCRRRRKDNKTQERKGTRVQPGKRSEGK